MNKKTKSRLLPLAAGLILLAALLVLAFPVGREADESQTGTAAVGKDGALTIPVSSITETASFYPVVVDGTEMEVLAIRTAGGEIRTAMNTCQSCYLSGRGFYAADGTELVCQNCGFRFTADRVGVEGYGGCNPWPITASQREETADAVVIPYETFLTAKDAFANWKA